MHVHARYILEAPNTLGWNDLEGSSDSVNIVILQFIFRFCFNFKKITPVLAVLVICKLCGSANSGLYDAVEYE